MHKNYISYFSLFWEKYCLWDIRVIGHFLTKSRDFETSITATPIIHCNTRGSTITAVAIKIAFETIYYHRWETHILPGKASGV